MTRAVTAPRPPVLPLVTLTARAGFLRAAQGGRAPMPGLLLQARDRGDGDPAVRVGFTCSRKLGKAVARNRAKRRLRAAARAELPLLARPGWDYVLVGRPEATLARPFADLCADLRAGLDRVHRARPAPAPAPHAATPPAPAADSPATSAPPASAPPVPAPAPAPSAPPASAPAPAPPAATPPASA